MIKVQFESNCTGTLSMDNMTPNYSRNWKNIKIVTDDTYDFLVISASKFSSVSYT